MEQGNEVEFVVDQQYENEKGVFTVLSIHRSEMVIRWESGEEIRTDIELQRNIQARRQWEVLEKEKAALAAKSGRKGGAARAAAVFEGFKETDFKKSASGTKWRGRNQLGGSVTHKLPDNRYNFNSWAFANKPEMHWLDVSHHKSLSGENRAKFFVRVNLDTMFYGFSVGRVKDAAESCANWETLIYWLKEDDNEEVIHGVASKLGVSLYDKNYPENKVLTPTEDAWQLSEGGKQEKVEKLADFLETLAAEGDVSLEVAKLMEKEKAVASGKEIAVDISELFSQLIPIYRGAWAQIR